MNVENLGDLPYIEDVLNFPLSNFITFAANYCEYPRKTHNLIVNRVHPMFLKANDAASKEDKPNWWESTSGPFVDEY